MRGAAAPDSRFKSLIKWPAFLIANAVLFLFVGVSTAREAYRGWSVDHEIAALQAQAKELEGQKMELMALTDALNALATFQVTLSEAVAAGDLVATQADQATLPRKALTARIAALSFAARVQATSLSARLQ